VRLSFIVDKKGVFPILQGKKTYTVFSMLMGKDIGIVNREKESPFRRRKGKGKPPYTPSLMGIENGSLSF